MQILRPEDHPLVSSSASLVQVLGPLLAQHGTSTVPQHQLFILAIFQLVQWQMQWTSTPQLLPGFPFILLHPRGEACGPCGQLGSSWREAVGHCGLRGPAGPSLALIRVEGPHTQHLTSTASLKTARSCSECPQEQKWAFLCETGRPSVNSAAVQKTRGIPARGAVESPHLPAALLYARAFPSAGSASSWQI